MIPSEGGTSKALVRKSEAPVRNKRDTRKERAIYERDTGKTRLRNERGATQEDTSREGATCKDQYVM